MSTSVSRLWGSLGNFQVAGNIGLMTLFIALVYILAAIVVQKIFTKYIFPALSKFASRTNNDWDDCILDAFLHPLEWLIILSGIFAALNTLPFNARIDHAILVSYRSFFIILITWGLYDIASKDFLLAEDLKNKYNIDNMLIPLLSNALRFIILALALVILIEELGYEVNGLIAGLGLGGLAFALAAQNTIANMFGGIVIISDKPFTIGDWIRTASAEGTVEDISFRSTRLRAFDQSLITVPNSTLANESITNFTRMGKRRISFDLGLTYNTSRNQMEECINRIRAMLMAHKDVHPETIMVYFNKFNDSSLDIFIYFFTITTNWSEYLAVREDIHLEIMTIIEELGLNIAFPTQSIYLENLKELKSN